YQDVAVPAIVAAARKAFANVRPLSVEFSGIDHFPNEMLVLWARPTDERVLKRIHRAIHGEIDPALCHEHYRPDRWQPHCTVAMKIPASAAERALAWAKATPAGFTLVFDVVDCVSFPPVEIINEVKLLP
ncbi:MAG: 2'-5' RNA ligase family protein, partial [Rhizobium sp.]